MKNYFSAMKASNSTLTLALPAKANMQRVFNWLNITNDKASTTLFAHKTKLIKTSSASAAAAQKLILCTATAGVVANDLVIIQDVVDPDKYEYQVIGAVVANTSYATTANLANTYAAGAKIHCVCTGGGASAPDFSIAVGIATVEKSNATAVFVADKNEAVLWSHSAATAICDMYMSGILRS